MKEEDVLCLLVFFAFVLLLLGFWLFLKGVD